MGRAGAGRGVDGGLIEVATETLRERYNRALEILCGRRTARERFHIDQTGYSPQVAAELGDPDYLNPHRCNRKFILLTLDQAELPVLGATFSSTRSILRRFVEANRAELFALTTRDVVYGELENSVYRIDTLEDLASIKRITVDVHTGFGLISKARALAGKIAAFEASDSDWHDDGKLAEMIELAQATGDIRRHPLVPARVEFRQGNFYTSHFGGLYVFHDVPEPALISCDPAFAETHLGDRADAAEVFGLRHIRLADAPALAAFFQAEGLAEPVSHGGNALEGLKGKLELVVVDHAAQSGRLEPGDIPYREQVKRIIYEQLDELPEVFHQLSQTVRAMEQGAPPPAFDATAPAYFYLLRASGHPDRDLVEHLLARLTPLDARQLYLGDRERFDRKFEAWPKAKQDFVSAFLARPRLPEPVPDAPPEPAAFSGPWGARIEEEGG